MNIRVLCRLRQKNQKINQTEPTPIDLGWFDSINWFGFFLNKIMMGWLGHDLKSQIAG